MKLQNIQLVAELATQLTALEKFHETCGQRQYGKPKEEKFELMLRREDCTDIGMPVLRESALAVVIAERERIKGLMRKYGVEFIEDVSHG